MAFLYRDLFTVHLNDGLTITAVMPEELFSVWNPNVRYTIVNRPSVKVKMREPPAFPKIVDAGPSGFRGPGSRLSCCRISGNTKGRPMST